jgi:Protein involved in mRNA turnover and stability
MLKDCQTEVETEVETEVDTISLCEPCCRVCQCDASEEELISPCLCSGSVKWIHESCLIQWMKSSFKESCELCIQKIKTTKRRKPIWKVCFLLCFTKIITGKGTIIRNPTIMYRNLSSLREFGL